MAIVNNSDILIIKAFLKGLGMTWTSLDYYIFVLEDKDLFITIYVLNLFIIRSSITSINELKKSLIKRFKIIDIRVVIKYLNIEIKRRLNGIVLH